MSLKINQEQLKTMIANQIKDMNLHDILDSAAIETIQTRIKDAYSHQKAVSEVPDMIPEAITPSISSDEVANTEPNEEENIITATSVEKALPPTDLTQQSGQNIDSGNTGNIPSYKPELPSFLDKIEPAKIIIFSQNELSEGGENLSHKPLRTFSDPDCKKSIHDFWIEEGKKRAEVYIAKLEKIGEIEYNFANGTSQFIEKRFEPDFEAQAKYKSNPYMADNAGPATPGELDINGQPNIMNQIATAVDLEKVVSDLVMKILQNQLMTNSTKAINDVSEKPYTLGALNPNELGRKTDEQGFYTNESFNTKMIDIVNNYSKIDAPVTLREAIEKGDKKFLIRENEEVQEWEIDGKKYFTPVNKISNRKCYVQS